MNHKKRFFKTASIYFLGNVVTKLISFFMLPLYTARLSPASFGYYDVSISVLNLAVPILFFQIWDGVFRFTFDHEDKKQKAQVINNGLLMMAASIVLYVAVFFVFGMFWEIQNPALVFVYGLFLALQYYFTVIARSYLKNTLYVVSGCVSSAVNIASNLVLILVFNMGIEALYISFAAGTLIQVAIIWCVIHPFRGFKIAGCSFDKIKKLLKFSAPIAVNTVSYWLLNGLTKVVIINKLSAVESGLYAVTTKFSSLIVLAVGVFQFAWNETTYILSGDENKAARYSYGINMMFKMIALGGAAAILITKIIYPYFIDSQYQASLQIIPITLSGVAVNAFATFCGTVFLADKKSNVLFRTTVVAALVNVALLFLLSEYFGLVGATLSLGISFLVCAVMRLIKLKRLSVTLRLKNLWYLIFPVISVLVFYMNTSVLVDGLVAVVIIGFIVYMIKDILLLLIKSLKRKKQ